MPKPCNSGKMIITTSVRDLSYGSLHGIRCEPVFWEDPMYIHAYLPTYLPTCIHTYLHTDRQTRRHTCTMKYIHIHIFQYFFKDHESYKDHFIKKQKRQDDSRKKDIQRPHPRWLRLTAWCLDFLDGAQESCSLFSWTTFLRWGPRVPVVSRILGEDFIKKGP